MKFVPFLGKPVIRRAFKLSPRHKVKHLKGEIEVTDLETGDVLIAQIANDVLATTGDYIVRLSGEDTYHCTAMVFKQRNFVGLTNKLLLKREQFINFIKRTFSKLRRKI